MQDQITSTADSDDQAFDSLEVSEGTLLHRMPHLAFGAGGTPDLSSEMALGTFGLLAGPSMPGEFEEAAAAVMSVRLEPGQYRPGMANRYEYAVVELREGMLGGKMSGEKLQTVLNQQAAQGWQLKAITAVEVKGRVGPGGVEGVLVTFERPVG